MKPAPAKSPQSAPEANTSWADVARASAEVKLERPPTPERFPGGGELQAGDTVLHAKFGPCTVHRILGDLIHMAPENGRVIKLSQKIVSFTPVSIDKSRRVFSTSKRQ